MRLRLLDRIRRSRRRQQPDRARARDRSDGGGAGVAGAGGGTAPGPVTPGVVGAHRRVGGGRSAPPRPSVGQPANGARLGGQAPPAAGSPRQAPGHGSPAGHALPRRWAIARVATRAAPKADTAADPVARAQPAQAIRTAEAKPPWYEIAQSNRTAAGRRHCGHIEKLIHREWADDVTPPPEVVRAIDRLAELPQLIKARLAAGLDAIYVGMGGVPNLDDMGQLAGVPLP